MAQIIKFEPGVPLVLALKFDAGKNCEGKFGPQVQYTTTRDQIFWLDPEPAGDVERELQDLGIRAGQEFSLTKCKGTHGGHSWRVERVRGDAGGHNVPARSSSGAGAWSDAPVPPHKEANNPTNNPSTAREPLPPPAEHRVTPQAARMMACFLSAIDAVAEAQQYATRKGLGITFSSENVTSAALSCYINECKGGR